MINWTALRAWVLLSAVSALTACAGGTRIVQPAAGGTSVTAPLAVVAASQPDGFSLTVAPESYLTADSTAQFAIENQSQPSELNGGGGEQQGDSAASGVVVTISAREAVDLRALYCDLRYDPKRYTPLEVEHLPWAGAARKGEAPVSPAREMLTLEVLSEPGVVHLGQVLAHWDRRAGLTGDADLARVRFAAQPFSDTKAVSAETPVAAEAPQLVVIMQPAWLDWRWRQLGDYNQDGLVTASDLTPLGAHFGERGEEKAGLVPLPDGSYGERFDFAGGDVRQLYDTSENGAIDIYDITAIGVNFGRGADSFAVYHALSPAAYSAEGTPAVEPLTVFPLTQVRRGEPADELVVYNAPLPGLVDRDYYWIQPQNGGTPGPASEFARIDLSIVDDFTAELRDECFLDGGQVDGVRAEVGVSGEEVAVDLLIHGYERMHFLSMSLSYDPQLYRARDFPGTWGSILERKSPLLPPLFQQRRFYHFRALAESRVVTVFNYSNVTPGDEWRIARAFFQREPEQVVFGLNPGSGMDTPLFYDPATQLLSWKYYLPGDANQDSLVLTDDLIPITRFLAQSADDPDSASGVADFNNNAVVDVADITAIGQYFAYHLEGYRIFMGSEDSFLDFGAGGQLLGSVSVLDDAIGDRFAERLRFEFHVLNPVSGQRLWLAPYAGNETSSPLLWSATIP